MQGIWRREVTLVTRVKLWMVHMDEKVKARGSNSPMKWTGTNWQLRLNVAQGPDLSIVIYLGAIVWLLCVVVMLCGHNEINEMRSIWDPNQTIVECRRGIV
jgi:hypothetical protein